MSAFEEAARWLEAQARELRFGEAAVRLIIHDHRISRIERSTTVKLQPDQGASNGRAGS